MMVLMTSQVMKLSTALRREHLRRFAGALLGLSPARGAHFDWEWRSRYSAVLILLTFEVISTILGRPKLSSRLRAVRILKNELSPVRGAHFHAHL